MLPAAQAQAQVGIETVCLNGISAPPNYTLTEDCVTTQPLTVDPGGTLDGGGFTITANDPSATVFFKGAVVLNEGPGLMNVTNLIIQGGVFAESCGGILAGIQFADAGGTVSNVEVHDITQTSGCGIGNGIRVNAVVGGTPRTVEITDAIVDGFNRSGLLLNGPATVNVSGSVIGPGDLLPPGLTAQNAVQYGSGGAGGVFSGNTVVGVGFGGPPVVPGTVATSTGMLLFNASNLTISDNTITGADTDVGISVTGDAVLGPSTNITIENNVIRRDGPGTTDPPFGHGVSVDALSTGGATLLCNEFSGWVTNLVNVTQTPCITTTALPNGTLGTPYSAPVAGHTPNQGPITWSVTGGSLPPGLTMAANGTISGTPTREGSFTFTVAATDAVPSTATKDFTITVGPVADLVGLVDPATGIWSLRGAAGGVTTFYYGNPGDVPFAGDWDCDGDDTPGLYRQSDGFVYLRNSNTQGIADIRFFFGNPGDIPMAGDFNNDGCDTVGIYRPSNTTFYVINKLGANNGGLGPADFSFIFGNPADKPFVGDFNNDGIDTIGLHRESTGIVYFRLTNTTGVADAEFYYGNPDDRFVAGDWVIVDGIDTPGVFRPSNATFFLRNSNTQGVGNVSFPFGDANDLPIAGVWAP